MKKLILIISVLLASCGQEIPYEPIHDIEYTVWSIEYTTGKYMYKAYCSYYDGNHFHRMVLYTDSNYKVGQILKIKP